MKKAIITISGGIDSTLTAAIAKKEGYELCFLTANYGQKNLNRELANSKYFAKYYGVNEHKIIDMTWLGKMGNSLITNYDVEVDINDDYQIYVPFRNTCILASAIAWAETDNDIERIYIGCDGQSAQICPDNSVEYIEAINKLIKIAVRDNQKLEVIAPLNHLTKEDIIMKAIEYDVPLAHTWTCVSNGQIACGKCDPCRARKDAFKNIGIQDPTIYKE